MLDRNIYKLAKSNTLFRKVIWVNFWRYRSLTSGLRTLPDFIIVGAQRCGTSSLFLSLLNHPSVLSPTGQELKFFTQNFDKGIKYYKSYFPLKIQKHINRIFHSLSLTGEGDSAYLFFPVCASRMYELNPDLKIIILLRNPVDRAYLHYLRMFKQRKETLSFEEALEAESSRIESSLLKLERGEYSETYDRFAYLDKGIYLKHLQPWFSCFPRKHIQIIQTENFFKEPDRIYRKTLDFLGLEGLAHISYKMAGACSSPPMKTETANFLQEYYKPYNEKLYEFLGESFDWDRYEEPSWYGKLEAKV